jgi:hypothetical protein
MKVETISHALENDKTLGIQISSNNEEVGWYIILKRKLINNFFEKFSEISDARIYKEQLFIKENPYEILEFKVTKETFDRGYILNNHEYIVKKSYYHKTLSDTLEFIKNHGFTNENIVWLVDLIYVD